nr:hypothetical protein [Tanacetum cinerariifolium]
ATGEAAPKPKASARRKRSDLDTSITPPTTTSTPITTVAAAPRLTTAAKGKQPVKAKNDAERDDDDDDNNDDEEEIAKIDESEDTESGGGDEEETESDEESAEEEIMEEEEESFDLIPRTPKDKETKSDEESAEEETREEEEESFDPIPRTPEDSKDDGNGEEDQGLRVSEEQMLIKEEEADELYQDVDINQGRGLQVSQDIEDSHVTLTPVHPDGQQESSSVSSFVTSMLNPISDAGVESIFTTASSSLAPLPTPIPTMTPSIITTITTASHTSIPPTPIPTSFSEYMQTNPFAKAVSNIPGIVHQYMNQQMHEAVRVAVQIQTDRFHDSYQRENDEFLKTINDNIKRIIKEQVKSQVKDQVSRILPRIEQSVNAHLESKVLTRSSHSSRTSYAVAVDLSEMKRKKILIEKMEGNKSIQRGDDDDQEGPSAESDWGSKRRREGGEPESASTPSEIATRSASMSTTGTRSRQMSASESAFAEEPVQTTCQMDEPSHSVFETCAEDQPIVQTSQHPEWFSQPRKPPTPDRDWNKTLPAVQGSAQTWISELVKQADSRSSFNKLLDTPIDFSNFIMNRLCVDTLTLELLARPTYELMRGSYNSLTKLEYHLEEVDKATTDQLDWVNPEGQQYPHNLLQPLPFIPDN